MADSERTTELAEAIEDSFRVAAYPWSLPQARPRDRWEALLSLLLGCPPVLGKMRAGDLAYLDKGESARKLAQELARGRIRTGGGGKWSFLLEQDMARLDARARASVLDASLVLRTAGLAVLWESLEKEHTMGTAGELYQGQIDDLVRVARGLGLPLGGTLARIMGVPTFQFERSPSVRDSSFFARAAGLLKGKAGTSKDDAWADAEWHVVHIGARRIHSAYMRRFHQNSLQRGASAMVQEVIACIREGLVERTSIACLVQDLGGHLVFLVPAKLLEKGERRDPLVWLSATIDEILVTALSKGGYFAAVYPNEWEEAERVSQSSRRMGIAAWRGRGLFPDLCLRSSLTTLRREAEAWRSGTFTVAPAMEITLAGDRELLEAPPALPRRACYGCHVERRSISPPWWPENEKICPGCSLVVAAGQRLLQQTLEGMRQIARVFETCLLPVSLASLSREIVTLYLDGIGVGRHVQRTPLLARPGKSQRLEGELRHRYKAGVEAVAACCEKEWPDEARAQFDREQRLLPIEVLWMGGDDLCVSMLPSLALPFLKGFFGVEGREQDTGLTFAGAVLRHSADAYEKARASHALTGLLDSTKRQARRLGTGCDLPCRSGHSGGTGADPAGPITFVGCLQLADMQSLSGLHSGTDTASGESLLAFARLRSLEELSHPAGCLLARFDSAPAPIQEASCSASSALP